MKVKISYTQEEKQQAERAAAMILKQTDSNQITSVKKSDRHTPFYHIYIAVKSAKKP